MKTRVFQDVVLLSYTQTYPYFLKISTGDDLLHRSESSTPLCEESPAADYVRHVYTKSGKSRAKLYITGIDQPYVKEKIPAVSLTTDSQVAAPAPAEDAALINSTLPKELLLRIFSFLDVVALCRCAQVSKFWDVLALDGSNWQRVDLFRFQRDVDDSVVEKLARRCGGFIKTLSLRGCQSVDHRAMGNIAQWCNNIEELNLTNCKKITDSVCVSLGKHCHRLSVLELDSCTQITDTSMEAISRGCPQLLTIDISWTDISDAGLQALSKGCPRLRAIIAKGCHSITDEGLRWVGQHCRDLRLLNLHSCYKMNQTRGFGDEGVLHVSNGCHQMEFLCLAGCANLTDSSLLALSQGCPKLRTLEVAGCSQFQDVGFQALAKNCGELRRMDLEECVLISDAALLHLAAGCPKLQRLSLSHCELITDEGIGHLARGEGGPDHLTVLELDGCPLISDAALDRLLACRRLQRIELYDSQLVTRSGIRRLERSLPLLKVHAYFAPSTPVTPTGPAPAPDAARLCCCVQ